MIVEAGKFFFLVGGIGMVFAGIVYFNVPLVAFGVLFCCTYVFVQYILPSSIDDSVFEEGDL